jgi:hypothetical protein
MPKISKNLVQSVVFVCRRSNSHLLGSGFIVQRGSDVVIGEPHLYAVSNYHVTAERDSAIQLNTNDGKSRLLPFAPDDWKFEKAGHDVSAIDITEHVEETDEISAVSESLFFDERRIEASELGIGEDAFMLGMFVNNPGVGRNVPSARFGNVSMLADAGMPVEQGTGLRHPSHIVDMRSRTGFSGSPVFAFRTQSSHLDRVQRGHEGMHFSLNRHVDAFVGVLGIHCGQFPEAIQAERNNGPNETWRVPSSMTVVVPAWKIIELLDTEEFQELRKAREARWKSEGKVHFQ